MAPQGLYSQVSALWFVWLQCGMDVFSLCDLVWKLWFCLCQQHANMTLLTRASHCFILLTQVYHLSVFTINTYCRGLADTAVLSISELSPASNKLL